MLLLTRLYGIYVMCTQPHMFGHNRVVLSIAVSVLIFFCVYFVRVLLDLSKSSSPVIAERVLLQPFGLMLAVERNLTPWYTKIPAIFININMGEFKIYLGQDDLEEIAKFGADLGARVTTALQTMGKIFVVHVYYLPWHL